ncbi:hypothetical protein GV828_11655 [Flavobacterium sp. NST-5]|uniref:DUF2268 domain-containing protein n=1 Tax=Flavobacterium ichthyis TaxID=2698827 RepID=A0ABW9ZBE6_9FLAO|nr:DUF2268 domain-containing putative Zn-dependent protease [Flavobacterium ichthyis]NBL65857.1 hypothetical protein [Flavobacterium ichthyis]
MNKIPCLIVVLLFFNISNCQYKQVIETRDIEHFWNAFDQLQFAANKQDSITIIQTQYIEKATELFKEFIKVRNFTAEEYISLISQYPKFWHSIRKETEQIKYRKEDVEHILDQYEKEITNFKRPNVCFAIGCLRTGGTISDNLILIGTEIAASTPETEKSELSQWLKSVMGTFGDIVSMVSHETIHTQQQGQLRNLAEHSISEGVADFLSEKICSLTINKTSFKYGVANDCSLKKEFVADYYQNKFDLSNWLYNGNKSKNRPADLGYYIGYRIAQEYYNKTENKKKAISYLLHRKNYKKLFKKSEYLKINCDEPNSAF